MKTKLFFALLLISFVSIAQSVDYQKIDALIDSKIKESDPGLVVGIVKDGNIVYQKYRGQANLQYNSPVDENTKFNIASTAKQFVALMVLQLSLEEKLKLDDDIRKYLPKMYPAVKEKIRIRHLVNHSSGIRDYVDLLSIQRKTWWKQVGLDNDDIIALIEKQNDLGFTPGSNYQYSNTNYTLLTKIIEEASGKSFHEYSENFFKDLDMNNTFFAKNYMAVISKLALPYADWGDGVWQEYPALTNLYGDGFLYTTLKDQLAYERAVQNAKGNFNVLLIESQKPIKNSEIETYGFGLELQDKGNRTAVWHSGGTGAYHSHVVRFTEEGLSIFVMSANNQLNSAVIASEVADMLLPKLELPNTYDTALAKIKGASPTAELLGQYRSEKGVLVRLEQDAGTLYWKRDNNNPIALEKQKGNLYTVAGNASIKIGFNPGGTKQGSLTVFYPNSKKTTYTKSTVGMPSKPELETYAGTYTSAELDVSFDVELKRNNELHMWIDGEESGLIEVLNRTDLLFSDYRLKIERDVFDRVTAILVSSGRATDIRFAKKSNLQFQPKIPTNNGSINVTTIGSRDGESSQILLTKNYANGNEIWSRQFGGSSYDKASSIMATADGYLIVGSTSSYGNGNYDIFVVKTDKEGNKLWQQTYGDFYNEYGYAAEKVKGGYVIKGSIQNCSSNSDIFNRSCTNNVWFVTIDEKGNEITNQVLEAIE